MGLTDLLDLLEKLEGRVNAYWNFYSVAVFAVAGWLLAKEKLLTPRAAILIAVGLAAFFFANFGVIHFAEQRIAAVEQEISVVSRQSTVSPAFSSHLQTLSIPNRSTYTVVLHLTIDALLALLYVKRASSGNGTTGGQRD